MKTYTIKSRTNCTEEHYVTSLSHAIRIIRRRPENWRISRQLSGDHRAEQMVIISGPRGGVKIELA